MVTGHSVIVAGLIIMAAPVLSVSFGKRGAASFYMSAVVAIFIMVAVIGYMNVARLQRQMNFAEYLAEKTEGNVWCTVSDIRDSGQGWQVYVCASRIEMEVAGSIYTYTGKMKVLLYMDDVDKLMVGKRLELGADLARPDEATNPGEFDARKYYANKGIYIIGNDVVIKSLGDRYSLIRHMLYEFRIKAGKALEKCFSDADSSVVKAMLLGDKSGMDKDTKRLFQVNGIAHILAISGVKTLKLDIPLVPETRINWAFVPLHIAIIYILKLCLDEEIIPRCRFPCSRGYLTKYINWQKKQ